MGRIASGPGVRLALRLGLAACVAGLLAGCADSERLSDPFSNPFHTSSRAVDPTPTARYASPSNTVQSRPLPAPDSRKTAVAPSYYAAPAHPSPSLVSAQPQQADMTSSVRGQNIAGWTAEGGTPVVVALGESAEIIAKRYGIPPETLLRTNGFSASSQVRPGTRLIIPIYNAALATSSGVRLGQQRANERLVFTKGPQPASKVAKKEPAKNESKAALLKPKNAEHDQLKSKTEVAKLEAAKGDATASLGHKDGVKPGEPKDSAAKVPAPDPKKANLEPAPIVNAQTEAPEFRWPARGRIIQAFKRDANDGINIALPEGTPIRAAEAGVVAYAGSEVKGYGNLILIQHPNGFATAYANNGELTVKRGDTVKRGQIIAKSGQSGNVSLPQLHFELRKGSTPVDPTQYLAAL